MTRPNILQDTTDVASQVAKLFLTDDPNSNSLNSLPPELWDQVLSYIDSASTLAQLSQTNRSFYNFASHDGWKNFCRYRFPSLVLPSPYPSSPSDISTSNDTSWRDAARSLTSVSRSWDRRAFTGRFIQPHTGDSIHAYPGGQIVDRWQRPQGQTIGFAPHLSVLEEGEWGMGRMETLAFCTGAGVCVRRVRRGGKGDDRARWMTYQPVGGREGRDDVTTLHLLRPSEGEGGESGIGGKEVKMVMGTADGELQMVTLPLADDGDADKEEKEKHDVEVQHFITDGQTVRGSSIMRHPESSHFNGIMAVTFGDRLISLYNTNSTSNNTPSLSHLNLSNSNSRIWTTSFLSPSHLAIGTGPSSSPIQIHTLLPSGISSLPTHSLSLTEDGARLSSIYSITPLPPSTSSGASSSSSGTIFLTGAYDGAVRLHDLRSPHSVSQIYLDPADDSPIYSLLTRGQEKFLAGASRHNLLKVFDLRLNAICYDYRNARHHQSHHKADDEDSGSGNFNLFLRSTTHTDDIPSSSNTTNGGTSRRWGRNRRGRAPAAAAVPDSSVYALAAASEHSPYIYAGIENQVIGLEVCSVVDEKPDPAYFSKVDRGDRGEVANLSMYAHDKNTTLLVQRSIKEVARLRDERKKRKTMRKEKRKGEGTDVEDEDEEEEGDLDERWVNAAQTGGGRWTTGLVP